MEIPFREDIATNENFQILFVCTGNVCRSPLAELILSQKLKALPVVVASAGTRALVGKPIQRQSREIATNLGFSDEHARFARQLQAEDIKTSDLILALDRGHRRSIVEMVPRASRRTFTVREFSRLASHAMKSMSDASEPGVTATILRGTVETVAQLRGTLPLLDEPSQDDVRDPYGKDNSVYEESANELVPAVLTIAAMFSHGIEDRSK